MYDSTLVIYRPIRQTWQYGRETWRLNSLQPDASRRNERRYYNRDMQIDVVFTDESDVSFSELLDAAAVVGPDSRGINRIICML